MSRILAAMFLVSTAIGTAAANGGLEDDVAGKAVTCWTTQTGMRGITLAVDLDVGLDAEGGVEKVTILDFAPETETGKALAQDVAAALKACGPYMTDGRRQLSLRVVWPR